MTDVFILAGEASGDRIGANLIVGLRRARPDLSISGVGGDAMEGEGLSSLFPIDDLAGPPGRFCRPAATTGRRGADRRAGLLQGRGALSA